ncbi:membrane-binding protein [Riemerella anatipestifer]|uniref:membrane-binding protein n=1 Tax=Riemerella anatipestifer TaxID=34085 RepID=UPI000D13F434|nr:membrane-binding protein [Riemerella anatipestifer]PST45213.1 membrane-binding protein [Riemerella anatipestifer]
MAKKSYSENITSAKVMADGLSRYKSNLPAGVQESQISELETLRQTIETLNSEQEKLKADLKTKTQALETKLNELQKLYAQLKKRIKLDIAQSQWKEFGIEDKH